MQAAVLLNQRRHSRLQNLTDGVIESGLRQGRVQALARSLKFSSSFNESDFLVGELDNLAELSEHARKAIQTALKFNDQVRGRANARALIADEHVSV